MALTARREKFVQLVAAGKSQREAFVTAYPNAAKWKEGVAASRASDMAARPEVRARLLELKEMVKAEAEQLFTLTHAQIKAAVLEDAWDVLRADPSDLVTYRRSNCRHCHGMNHAYRWRDEPEFWAALATASEAQDVWDQTALERRSRRRPTLPSEEGGYGFRTLAPPDPACPKCEGEGVEDARIADIRTLSGPARRLYAGLETKKDGGIKLMLRNKEAARELLAKHAGLIVDKVLHAGVVGTVPLAITDEMRAEVLRLLENDI